MLSFSKQETIANFVIVCLYRVRIPSFETVIECVNIVVKFLKLKESICKTKKVFNVERYCFSQQAAFAPKIELEAKTLQHFKAAETLIIRKQPQNPFISDS